MDRSYLLRRRVRPDQGNSSKVGGCDFCYQKNVKIRPLECQNHFFCQVCEEFCPKIRKGDFTCRKCSHRTRMLDDENRKRVDDFYVKQEGLVKPKGFEEVIISIDGSNFISFDDDDDDEEGDDLSGNNNEWDFLLQSLTNKDTGAENAPTTIKANSDKTEKQKISKQKEVDSVFPKLNASQILSSGGSDESSLFTFVGPMGTTGLSIKPEEENISSTLEMAPELGSSSPNFPHTVQLLPDQQDGEESVILAADSDSLSERGTSPVKRPPKMLDAASWLGLRRSTTKDESASQIELYNIEGPSFRDRASSPGNDGSAFERDILHGDDFWDF